MSAIQRIHQIEGTKMSYKGKKLSARSGGTKTLSEDVPDDYTWWYSSLRWEICGEQASNSIWASRTTTFSFADSFFPDPSRIGPGTQNRPKIIKFSFFFNWKYVFSYLLEFLKPFEKLNMLGYLRFLNFYFLWVFGGSQFPESSKKVLQR